MLVWLALPPPGRSEER